MDGSLTDIRTVAIAGILGIVAITLYRKATNTRNPASLPYPPGPKPSWIPFIGNIADMPSSQGAL